MRWVKVDTRAGVSALVQQECGHVRAGWKVKIFSGGCSGGEYAVLALARKREVICPKARLILRLRLSCRGRDAEFVVQIRAAMPSEVEGEDFFSRAGQRRGYAQWWH
jgi:hypothetical protein